MGPNRLDDQPTGPRARGPEAESPRLMAAVIAGPTASGKSALAARLAAERDGVVINADSMQVFRDLRVLTARPSEAEERLVPHALYGHVDGATPHSVGHWLASLAVALGEARAAGRLPILVGGTGLYLRAALEGLSPMPTVAPAVRAGIAAWAEGRETPELHAELERRDPLTAARLRPRDRQRVLRALEVFEGTGRALASFHGPREAALLDPGRTVVMFLAPERERLREAIDGRFDAMLRAGALEEVAALGARKLDPALPVMRAHGVLHLLAHIAGTLSLEDAAARSKADTRAYAKRQFTWFRHQMPNAEWVPAEGALARLKDRLDEASSRPVNLDRTVLTA